MSNKDELKRVAAEKAVEWVESGMVVGLGTGSTAIHAVRAIGRLLQNGRLQDIVAIPTSERTATAARECGIPLTTLSQHPIVDVTIDGADEVDPNLDLIKGLGGALLREKIVAAASTRSVIIGDDSKDVALLASRAPVPVEVVPFAEQPVTTYLTSLGARVVKRIFEGKIFITDEKNIILDCHFEPLTDPYQMAQAILQQPGVVEHGLFLGLTTDVILASADGITIRQR